MKDKTVEELKILAFEAYEQAQHAQTVLNQCTQAINQLRAEIAKREEEASQKTNGKTQEGK